MQRPIFSLLKTPPVLGRGFTAPSDMLRLGAIGAGGKGDSDITGLVKAGVSVAALCDVDFRNARRTVARNPDAKRFYEDGYKEFFWPDFPRDFVMIEVKPRWLEYLGPEIHAHGETWRPQAVVFAQAPDR